MQEHLFDLGDIPLHSRSRLDESVHQRYPVLEALGIHIDRYDHISQPYLRVELAAEAPVFVCGYDFQTQWTDAYAAADNLIWWKQAENYRASEEGFLVCAATPKGTKNPGGTVPEEPLLHIVCDITDVEFSSVAVRLKDIIRLHRYPENTATVMAMYQNGSEDGVYEYHDARKNIWNGIELGELEALVGQFWPEPELIYERPSM